MVPRPRAPGRARWPGAAPAVGRGALGPTATRPAGPRACRRRAGAGARAPTTRRRPRAPASPRRRSACSTRCRRRAPAAARAARSGSSRRPRPGPITTSAASRAESASFTVARDTPGASVPTIATREAPRAKARAKASAMRAPRSSPGCASRRTPGSQSRISASASGGSKKTSRSYSPGGRRGLEHVLGERAVQVGRGLGADRRGEARLHRARAGEAEGRRRASGRSGRPLLQRDVPAPRRWRSAKSRYCSQSYAVRACVPRRR